MKHQPSATYRLVDAFVVFVCLPVYAIALPLFFVCRAVTTSRRIRVGLERSNWILRGLRVDFLVVDVARIGERLVGVRYRCVSGRDRQPLPRYSEDVRYVTIARFWGFGGRRAHVAFLRSCRSA